MATTRLTPDQGNQVAGFVTQYIASQGKKYAPQGDPAGCPAEGCLGQSLLAATSGGNAASRPEKGASC
jgi:hypothetical protein